MFNEDVQAAKRLSLVTASDRCHASSSAAPHASLLALLSQMLRIRPRILDLEESEEELDPGWIADKLRVWADAVRAVVNKCNKVELQRSDDVFDSIDWYNKNIDASKKNGMAMYEAGKKKAEEELQDKVLKEVQQVKAEMEKKMEELKQMYEDRLAKAGVDTPSNDAEHPAALAILTPASTPSEATPTTAPLPTISVPTNSFSSTDAAQMAFWKSKYDSLADQNAELRKAKSEDSAVKYIVHDEIEKIKKHYEMQIDHQKTRAELLADNNADLRRQLQERASPGEKRKAYGDLEDGYSGAGGESPKRARSFEG